MPTTKPRIAVTLNRRVYETIERLAALQGKSRGAVVAELLDSIHEPLMRTVALLDAAAQAPEEVKRGLRGVIEGVEAQLVGAAGGGLAQLDWLRARVSGGARAPRSGASVASPRVGAVGRAKRGPTPVPVTRGSGGAKRGVRR